MKRIQGLLIAGFVAAGVLSAGAAVAAQDPLAVVDARKAELKKAGGAMKAIGAFLKEGKGTVADVQAGAATIDGVSKAFPGWWPTGTAIGVGESEAKPNIWENMDDFKAKTVAFQTASAELVTAAAGGDKAAIGAALGKVGGTCKGCHETYRK
ncbi:MULTISPECIES: cytochrome c [unclassified Azospirillum]|uniref:c-type cytochrome n=1 Tax=unclassified Azospirillum TaxID=2630922 RepID=UPI000B6F4D02|nr:MULTISPECIES: cytochrome c [unclassified Azospirillum]SNS96276.1 Cytochrome c556 [Azospirillum sp. RU38E]SNT12757.1 Cytochrome c556 [Azospirillum sp. RU37A]